MNITENYINSLLGDPPEKLEEGRIINKIKDLASNLPGARKGFLFKSKPKPKPVINIVEIYPETYQNIFDRAIFICTIKLIWEWVVKNAKKNSACTKKGNKYLKEINNEYNGIMAFLDSHLNPEYVQRVPKFGKEDFDKLYDLYVDDDDMIDAWCGN